MFREKFGTCIVIKCRIIQDGSSNLLDFNINIADIAQKNFVQHKTSIFKESTAAVDERKSVHDPAHNKIRNKRSPIIGLDIDLFKKPLLGFHPSFRKFIDDMAYGLTRLEEMMERS